MSDETREWRFYLDDMIVFAEKVSAYTVGFDQPVLLALRNLELIGEAATHVPEAIRTAHPEIPWRLVIATRNRLIHGYLGVDDDVLWTTLNRWSFANRARGESEEMSHAGRLGCK